jgi:hypothetical protein
MVLEFVVLPSAAQDLEQLGELEDLPHRGGGGLGVGRAAHREGGGRVGWGVGVAGDDDVGSGGGRPPPKEHVDTTTLDG